MRQLVADTCGMTKTREQRREFWRQIMAQQQQSGLSVRAICEQHGISEYSFYQWRKRLAQQLPVKFALVEAGRNGYVPGEAVEVILHSGDRLRVGPDVDAATLRLVLNVLREVR
jgi:transposase-like protein